MCGFMACSSASFMLMVAVVVVFGGNGSSGGGSGDGDGTSGGGVIGNVVADVVVEFSFVSRRVSSLFLYAL